MEQKLSIKYKFKLTADESFAEGMSHSEVLERIEGVYADTIVG